MALCVGTTQRLRELLPVMTLTELNAGMTAVITVWWEKEAERDGLPCDEEAHSKRDPEHIVRLLYAYAHKK
jgi:hypothetical protein